MTQESLTNLCPKCGKPYWAIGTETAIDLCTCGESEETKEWQYCPHCGKELK